VFYLHKEAEVRLFFSSLLANESFDLMHVFVDLASKKLLIDNSPPQFTLRLKTLLDKKRVIQSRRTVTNAKAPANFVALFEGFQQFDDDLNKLQVSVQPNPA
jgi:CDK inhibitor PHO81